jgi:uncharacterized iron-regulated membrane protein
VSDMGSWQRWLRAPQTLPLRRLLFQVHLWLGIGVGLYVLLISVSGSAIVLRPQIARWFTPSEVPAIVGAPLQGAELAARVTAVYVDARVVRISEPQREGRSTYVLLERDGREQSRYFDQYSGQDLGPTFPWQVATVEWLTRLHDDLLLDRPGRRWNGVGGLLFLGMVASGMVLWWQGSSRWQDGLLIRRSSRRSLFWQMHSALGFWSLLLLFIWGFTAVYFAWPEPFDRFIDFLDEDLQDDTRPDSWLLWMIQLHFGRFRGLLWANVLWIVLGLLPAILYVSGFVLWYRRVLRVWWRQQASGTP